MRILMSIVILFYFIHLNGQTNIEKDNLIGCWEFVDYADSASLKDLNMPRIFEHDIKFINESKYETASRKGDWELKDGAIIIYKDEFTDDEKEMAQYFNQTPRKATRIEYLDARLKDGFLYYLIYSEAEPFVLYAKLKKVNCK